jgi:hypothetical protein
MDRHNKVKLNCDDNVNKNIPEELKNSTMDLKIIKQSYLIEKIYQEINIKKALIICNYITEDFINLLILNDHNICTVENFTKFLNFEKRLLILTIENFKKYSIDIINDKYIDTLFLINYNITNKIIDTFKNKIIIYDLTNL